MKRIFLIVLDSFGIGAMPDAEHFGDVGVNTLAACATSEKLNIPTMIAAGLGDLNGYTNAITLAAAKASGKCNFVFKMMFFNCVLQELKKFG